MSGKGMLGLLHFSLAACDIADIEQSDVAGKVVWHFAKCLADVLRAFFCPNPSLIPPNTFITGISQYGHRLVMLFRKLVRCAALHFFMQVQLFIRLSP